MQPLNAVHGTEYYDPFRKTFVPNGTAQNIEAYYWAKAIHDGYVLVAKPPAKPVA